MGGVTLEALGYRIVEHAVGAVHGISSWWVGRRMAQVSSAIERNGKHGSSIQLLELSRVRVWDEQLAFRLDSTAFTRFLTATDTLGIVLPTARLAYDILVSGR